MPTRNLLVVDDDRAMREMLASLFAEQGFEVSEADSAQAAIDLASDTDFDAVLSDIKMPGGSGIELMGKLRKLRPDTPVVLMTAFGSIDSAVDAMRAGAVDYITKPFEPEAVLLTVERTLEKRELQQENRRLRKAVDETGKLGDLIGASASMREIFALIRRVAHSRSSVLVTGESGTGKEIVARTIHFHGNRAKKPFVPINCTAIPEGLLESELFGHVRGAFTGAHTSKRGLFEQANGGTLFLDEIGDMGPGLQSKLLRVLQDREIRPVGSNESTPIDVRIVAATNKNLQAALEDGSFREDLYYRLNVIPIEIPPLRERPEDIPLLVGAFLERHGDGTRRTLSSDAMRELMQRPWKGNARELENTIERALALSDAPELGVADVNEDGGGVEQGSRRIDIAEAVRQKIPLHDLEERYIQEVLDSVGGNKVQAAKILGIDRKTLYRKQKRRESAESQAANAAS